MLFIPGKIKQMITPSLLRSNLKTPAPSCGRGFQVRQPKADEKWYIKLYRNPKDCPCGLGHGISLGVGTEISKMD